MVEAERRERESRNERRKSMEGVGWSVKVGVYVVVCVCDEGCVSEGH